MAPVRHTPRAVARRQQAAQPPKQRLVDIVRERRKRNAKHSVPVMTAAVAGAALFVGAAIVGATPAPSVTDEQRALLAEANEPYGGAQKIGIPEMELLTPPLALFPSRPLFAPQVSRVAEVRALPLPERVEIRPEVNVQRLEAPRQVRVEAPRSGPHRPPVVRPTPKPTTPPTSEPPTSEPSPTPKPPRSERPRPVRELLKKLSPRRDRSSSSSDDSDSSSSRSGRSSRSSKRDSSSKSDSGSSRSSSSSSSDSGSTDSND